MMPNPSKSLCALACALATLTSVDVLASGYYLPGHGIRPLGRAGAFVVSGEQNLNSLWHNPANLAGMDELQLTIDAALVNLSFDFHRADRVEDNGAVTSFSPVSNEAWPTPIPQFLAGGKFILPNTSWALGLYAPYLPGQTFPENGAQRYTLVDNANSLAGFLHFALAFEFNDHVRIGAGLQYVPASFKFVNVASGYTGLYGRPEDEDLDLLSEVTLTSLTGFSGNFGFWTRLSSAFQAGLSVQLPVTFHDSDAKLKTRLPSHPTFNNAEQVGDSMDVSFMFPFVARAGIRFVQPTFDIELDVVFENWSAVERIDATPKDLEVAGVPGIGSIPVAPISIPQRWRDTFSVRLGGDFSVNEQLTVRAGYAFDSSAIPDETYSVFLADGDKHLLSVGGTLDFGTWSLDAAYGYYLMFDREITNSEVHQINPTDEHNQLTSVVGNGKYSQNYMAGGVGFNVRL